MEAVTAEQHVGIETQLAPERQPLADVARAQFDELAQLGRLQALLACTWGMPGMRHRRTAARHALG